MRKIKISEEQAKKLGLLKIKEDDENGLTSVNSLLGPNQILVVIEGPNMENQKDFVLARVNKFDPSNTLAYFPATKKLVGKLDSKKFKDISNELTKFNSNITMKNKAQPKLSEGKNRVKISKEQYNRIFANNLFESMNKVDKTFKKAFANKDIENLKEEEFDIKKPNTSIPMSAQGKFGKDLMEGDGQLRKETIELIKYLYRKTDEFSPFWVEKGITYDDICDALVSKNIIKPKDGGYQLSKTLGTSEEAISALENELNNLIGVNPSTEQNVGEKELENENSNYPAGAEHDPTAPYNQNDDMTTPTTPKNKKLAVVAYNNEIAILKSSDGSLYMFDWSNIDSNKFMEYAPLTRHYIGKDEDGNPDYEYNNDFEVDDDVLSNYVNDNLVNLKVGEGVEGWENGFDLVKIDNKMRQELSQLFDKSKTIVNALTQGLDENEEWVNVLKNNLNNQNKERKVIDKETIAKKLSDLKAKEMERRKAAGEIQEENEVISLAITPEIAKDFDEEDFSWWSDRYKEINGFRPRLSSEELITWANNTFKLEDNEYKLIKALDETTGAASSGAFTGPMTSEPIKREIGVVTESIDPKYTHFAILKVNNKIVNGWDYKGVDIESINYYSKLDLKDNFPEKKLSDFSIVSKNNLIKKGVDPFNPSSWNQSLNETTAGSGSVGAYDANALPGIGRDGSFKKTNKTTAEKKTQYANGSFVNFNDCVKYNNKPAGSGCSTGAVDNVVKLTKTKGNVNAPSLSEGSMVETPHQKKINQAKNLKLVNFIKK